MTGTERPWMDVVPDNRRSYDWPSIAAMLRANPGKWRLVLENERASLARAIRQGGIASLRPSDGFRVTTRNNTRDKPRKCDIYMAYEPEGEM